MSLAAYIAVTYCAKIKGRAKKIAYQLAEHANEQGYCYPSISRIASRLGQSKRNVEKGIQDLEQSGYLKVDRKRGALNRYYLDLAQMRADFPSADPPNFRSLAKKSSPANIQTQSSERKFPRLANKSSAEPVITSKELATPARAQVAHAALSNPRHSYNGRLRVDWDHLVQDYRDGLTAGRVPFWHANWGPRPTEKNCQVPVDILHRHGFGPKAIAA